MIVLEYVGDALVGLGILLALLRANWNIVFPLLIGGLALQGYYDLDAGRHAFAAFDGAALLTQIACWYLDRRLKARRS